MEIKETQTFTRRIRQLLDEESYRLLQLYLVDQPEAGKVIQHSGGIRKIRWSTHGSGKRGGTRIMYYWAVDADTILMLFVFAKNEQDDLSPDQLRQLTSIVKEEFK